MDTTGFPIPMMYKGPDGVEQPCEGKIFYMGIIDILQQYNVRKRFEARYRRVQGSGWQDASCVHPDLYAERFLKFFDEYTQRESQDVLEEGEEEVEFENDSKGEEEKAEVESVTEKGPAGPEPDVDGKAVETTKVE